MTARPAYATPRPATPPQRPYTTFSVSIWRITRLRLAPSADRTASSRRRPVARDSTRFARFAQASRSTKPTTSDSSVMIGIVSAPVIASRVGATRAVHPSLTVGCSRARTCAKRWTSAPACATVVPGFRRPLTRRMRSSRGASAVSVSGVHTSISEMLPISMSGVSRPTTVAGFPPSMSVWPMIDGSRFSSRSQ
jgi:hypothetical protein